MDAEWVSVQCAEGGRMPLYIVRWPHLQASLIEAEDDEDLVYKLDEVDDPGGCEWALYEGPVWIDFDLPLRDEGCRSTVRLSSVEQSH
jgi:hypothetical protein